mgnify:FL=1
MARNAHPSELLDEAASLADSMVALCRDDLLTSIKFTNRPLARLPHRIQMNRGGCMTDGREALFSPAFVLNNFKGARQVITRAYLHMIAHCLLRHPFPRADIDPLTWSVACDLSVGCVLGQLECDAITYKDDERDCRIAEWAHRVEQPTAQAFYALLVREGLSQEELAKLEIAIGMDSHELWFEDPEGLDPDRSQTESDAQHELKQRWEEIATATEMDMQREHDTAPSTLTSQLRGAHASTMSLEELLQIYAAPHESMTLDDEEFDYIYYSYGLRELDGIALVEPLEYRETPQIRDFCIAIDTSGSCSGPLVEAFASKACGMLLKSASVGDETRIWMVQCDSRVQDTRLLRTRDDVADWLSSLELKGFGGTDFRPVFELMDRMTDDGTVANWEALIYFTDGQGTFPDQAPPWDTAFVFVDEAGSCPAWATRVLTYSDELTSESER